MLVRDAAGGFDGIATLRDCALSVSASLGRSRQIAGRRYGHVLDPRTGRPLTRQRQAVVSAKSAAAAEAVSTALLILDAREGIELLDALPGVEGRLVEADGARLESAGFSEAVAFEPLESEPAASF